MMDRLTKKEEWVDCFTGVKFGYKTNDIYAFDKLGKLEDLEEELGCPLEVIFKAIEDGIIIIGDLKGNGDVTLWSNITTEICIGKKIDFEEPRLIKYNDWCFDCYSGSYSGCVSLKDYGETWWLVNDKEEQENDK